jgi:DNA-binding GntR family transcriptional regulator
MKMTFVELAEEAGLSVPEARKALKALERDGLLRSLPKGSDFPVAFTEKGRTLAGYFGYRV